MKQIKKITSNKGITLISLTITVIIMIILSFTVSVNITPYVERRKHTNLETDITKLKEEILHYYMENKNIPIVNKYTNTQMLDKNTNDNENYYVIDLSKLDDLELNYGKDFEKITDYSQEISDLLDIYIINEQSHTIYYPKGIEYDGEIYYTIMSLDSMQIQDMSVEGIVISGKNTGKINDEIQLVATVTPIFVPNTGVTWGTLDENIATVDETGKVTLKQLGTATITATSKDNDTITTIYEIQIIKSELEQLIEEQKYVSVKTKVEDADGNIVTIPKGFKVAADSGKNVTEGIVIEDNDIIEGIGNGRGNQYVWIPVGTEIKKYDGTTVDITLGIYIFADGTNHKGEDGIALPAGTPILKQSAEEYENETEIKNSELYPTETYSYGYKELKDYRAGAASSGLDGLNATALNLKGFIDSVKANGGYYIARYEASYGTDGKPNSKISNSFTTSSGSAYAPTTEGQLWNNITQINASIASRDLYTTINSDLINSYAWDTAIVYIQNFSNDSDYSRQNTLNSSLSNTGNLQEGIKDEVCKINDMASNTVEWTTEYSSYTFNTDAYPCTFRGGSYFSSNTYTSRRSDRTVTGSFDYITFRSALYL